MPLRLKSLELHGYKTFATRTLFEFAGGITAIVGPNGSGKSNIADSLRWVLGEQSFILLRGKKTEDMIFSGSEHRPRAGMASAEVIFDNSAGWLPVDFSEVAMARRAYRDGHNEYLLNGSHVRLRDMNELLAASGLSERTYTILGQGLVDASLALKADERRRLFEEAAGIGLYRVRREETLKRLETTQRNLDRVQDIMAELEPRLRTLERQARRAIEFGQAQADLRVLLLDWYGYHWHHAQEELSEIRETVRQQEIRVKELRELHLKAQEEYSAFRERIMVLRSQLNGWHRQSSELHTQRESVSRELAVLDERRRALAVSQSGLIAEQEHAADEEKLARERLAGVDGELSQLQSELEAARSQLEEAQKALQIRQMERADAEEKLQSARAAVEALHAQKAETQARLDELAARLASQKQKSDSIAQAIQAGTTAVKKAEQDLHTSVAAREKIEHAIQAASRSLEEAKQAVDRLEGERRTRQEERVARQTEHSRAQAQLEILVQAEQTLAGYAEGARFLLEAARQSRLNARGALSSALDVPLELETAIAAALGDTLDVVLLEADQVEQALHLLENEEAGRAALLSLDGKSHRILDHPDDEDCLGVASRLVKAPDDLQPAVELLLGQTLVVRHREAARRLLPGFPPHARIVTLRGEVFRGDGLVIAGKPASSSTLSRPRQKRELNESLADLTQRLKAVNAAVEKLTVDLSAAQKEQSVQEEQLGRLRLDLETAQADEQKNRLQLETVRRQLEWQETQQRDLQSEISEAEKERDELIRKAADHEARAAQAQADIHELTGLHAQLSLDELQEQTAYWSTRLAVIEQTANNIVARKSERQQALDLLTARGKSMQVRLSEAEQSLKDLDGEKTVLRERESALHAQLEQLQEKIEPAEKDLETAEHRENQLQEAEAAAQRNLSSAERIFGQMQLDHMRRQEVQDSLREKIMDDFGLVSFEYAANVEGPVPLPFEGMVEQLPVMTSLSPELEDQLTRQRAHLRRMGPINPEARKEYDSERERYTFLSTQMQDLRQAEADLRQVISELDELTRKEFARTYEAVDREFRQIFVRLFGGGAAHLVLTDPENLVETGIEIETRLPGRRQQGLSLLSGGERSLTAIALVFALLKVSPTPVCVMDEVDAMLDEANVGRFRDLLVDLSKDTQFIVITHNRNTVQAAEVIYGVTMGRDSTSQIISLKLDEVSEEMLGHTKS